MRGPVGEGARGGDGVGRQGDGEGAATAGGAGDVDPPAEGGDEAAADGQAEAGALGAVAFGVVELGELGGDAASGVAHLEEERAGGVDGGRDVDLTGVSELDGVGGQVLDHAGQRV